VLKEDKLEALEVKVAALKVALIGFIKSLKLPFKFSRLSLYLQSYIILAPFYKLITLI
jgi:hypothetical protein